jgi:hypothetical protein
MEKVLKELQYCIMVKDPCPYTLDKRISNSVVKDKYKLRAFFKGSYADNNMDNNYWKKVDYEFLEKRVGITPIVWYEFQGKHISIIN